MRPQDVRLPPELADRLARRAPDLLRFGTLLDDRREADPAEAEALAELARRLDNTYPYPDPHYAGQMLKPPHPVAWAAYAATMLLNPNNHALDGGPATATMEREAVAQIAGMLGLDPHLGHLTSSGTMANLEALWVARELAPDATIVSGANAHYTHARMAEVVGVRHETVAEDASGRVDLEALTARLGAGGVGTVVATLGTTSLGALDDLSAIADLCARHGARLHVDAAYGGFFALVAGSPDGVAAEPFAAAAGADSIAIDPHKHGLQPYGCGCVLFGDPGVGRLYAHASPYTYFTSDELHLGEISLECSRAGAAAAALWTTLRAFPLTADGLGAFLGAARRAGLGLAARLAADDRLALVVEPELDIVCPFARAPTASAIGAGSDRAFDDLAERGWHVAKLRVATDWLRRSHAWIEPDAETTTVLRCCLMKPEHLAVVDELADALAATLAG